jgi:Cys-rich protein (TIGR01571 family)
MEEPSVEVASKMEASKRESEEEEVDAAAAAPAPPAYAEPEDSDDSLGKSDLKKPAHGELPDFTFPMREVVIGMPNGKVIRFNPVASGFAILCLWGLAIWCMTNPEQARNTLVQSRTRIAELFTWFYIGTNPFFMFFMLWLAWRHGNIRLGPRDSEPEFSDITYFAMLFSAGIGVGLFFYGVSEPLWHQSSHWFAESGYRSQDEVDMFALNLTVFHWGITGWSQYLVVAVCAGLASFRFKLPMTLRSCFYPLLGDHTWGWIGDIIDGFTVVTTVAGVCTSLGLGCFQISAGLQRVGAIDDDMTEDETRKVHVIIIWVITLMATCSVVSGLSVGIRMLSELGFSLGMLLLFLVFVLDKTNYLLNLIVQEVGYYFQWSIFLLNFHTDAFGQLKEGEGRAVDGNAAAKWWMDNWTIFYIGWWVAWGAFVGLFIARVSYGRTIRSVIMYSYICPLVYTIIWFGVFGGVGLRQARQAEELKVLGDTYYNSTEHFLSDGSTYCYDVPQEDLVEGDELIFTNSLIGVTPVCLFNSTESDQAWFNVLWSFSYPLDTDSGFGPFLTWLSLFAVGIYFVTSSDSGSLIVDNLASNGNEDTHTLQRIFWAFTEGSVATALLVSGGDQALRALQAASILSGLPFTLFLVFMCMSIAQMCARAEANDNDDKETSLQDEYHSRRVFTMPIFGGIFDIMESVFSCGQTQHEERAKTSPCPSMSDFSNFFVATLFPFVPLYKIYNFLNPKDTDKRYNVMMTMFYACAFYLWIALFAIMSFTSGLRAFAWSALVTNGCVLCTVRGNVRAKFAIEGNMIADFIYGSVMWSQVLCQLVREIDEHGPNKDEIAV